MDPRPRFFVIGQLGIEERVHDLVTCDDEEIKCMHDLTDDEKVNEGVDPKVLTLRTL